MSAALIKKRFHVTVLAPDGTVLGTYSGLLQNPSYRMTKTRPVLVPFAVKGDLKGNHTCERHGEGWAVRLVAGQKPPKSLVPVTQEAVTA